jgi:predicted acetyltransferase
VHADEREQDGGASSKKRLPMQIDVVPVAAHEAGVLAQLYELYLYDFAERDGTGRQVADDGRFGESDVERFLNLPEHSAFLIRVDQKLAGFCMLKRGSSLAGDMDAMDVAEFFVLRNHRRQGVGRAAATLLWKQRPGRWLVRVGAHNQRALAFWTRTVADYTYGQYTQEALVQDDADGVEHWVVFRFVSAEPPSSPL